MKPRTSGTQYSDTFAVWKKNLHINADWVCTDNIVNDYIKRATLLPRFMNVHWSKLCCATASVCTDENFKLICRDVPIPELLDSEIKYLILEIIPTRLTSPSQIFLYIVK